MVWSLDDWAGQVVSRSLSRNKLTAKLPRTPRGMQTLKFLGVLGAPGGYIKFKTIERRASRGPAFVLDLHDFAFLIAAFF
jgi:hypothetical protein